MAVQAQLYQENLGFNPFPLSVNPQEWISDINGCGVASSLNQFSFNPHPKALNHQQQNQSLNHRNDTVFYTNDTIATANSQTPLFDHLEKRNKQEIDQYVKLQNERLRLILQEQRRREIAALIRKAEPKLVAILREKESEISEARKRTTELEDLVRKLEEESKQWQRLARENEATVLSLTNALERARDHAPAPSRRENSGADDAESCCGGGEGDEKRICRNCGWRKVSVLILPCRHFCSCKECEGFLDCCPVCAQPKKATIEALTF